MMSFPDFVLSEEYKAKTPQECLNKTISLISRSRNPRQNLKASAMLSLYALMNSTTDPLSKKLASSLLSAIDQI